MDEHLKQPWPVLARPDFDEECRMEFEKFGSQLERLRRKHETRRAE